MGSSSMSWMCMWRDDSTAPAPSFTELLTLPDWLAGAMRFSVFCGWTSSPTPSAPLSHKNSQMHHFPFSRHNAHRLCFECRIITAGNSCLPVQVTTQGNHITALLLSALHLISISNYPAYLHLAQRNMMQVILCPPWEIFSGISLLPKCYSQFDIR